MQQQTTPRSSTSPVGPTRIPNERDATTDELLDDIDELLDDIDDVLEHDAQDFLLGYRQRGGQ